MNFNFFSLNLYLPLFLQAITTETIRTTRDEEDEGIRVTIEMATMGIEVVTIVSREMTDLNKAVAEEINDLMIDKKVRNRTKISVEVTINDTNLEANRKRG